MSKITKDQIIKELINFYMDNYIGNQSDTIAWLIEGEYDADDFHEAVLKLQADMKKLEI